MKKIILSILSFVLIAFASIGGGLLLSACDYSYSENAEGGFDNSQNEDNEGLGDDNQDENLDNNEEIGNPSDDEVESQAITVGDYWRVSIFHGSSQEINNTTLRYTYQPYNGSYNPSHGTWTYSAQ